MEKANDLFELCISNQGNRFLQGQSIKGFYELLSFDDLVEAANLSKYNEDGNLSNRFAIAKCLWHSLWVTIEPESEESSSERFLSKSQNNSSSYFD